MLQKKIAALAIFWTKELTNASGSQPEKDLKLNRSKWPQRVLSEKRFSLERFSFRNLYVMTEVSRKIFLDMERLWKCVSYFKRNFGKHTPDGLKMQLNGGFECFRWHGRAGAIAVRWDLAPAAGFGEWRSPCCCAGPPPPPRSPGAQVHPGSTGHHAEAASTLGSPFPTCAWASDF